MIDLYSSDCSGGHESASRWLSRRVRPIETPRRAARAALWRDKESEQVISIPIGYAAISQSAAAPQGIRQSMGRVGRFDTAAAEAFFSLLK